MRRARYLADRLAVELLRAADVQPVGPINIHQVASRLQAELSPDATLAHDGQLIPYGDRALIRYRAGQPRARERYTIAHEIAHWALRSAALRTELALEARQAFTSEEVFANSVGGALLMPYGWMRKAFPQAADADNQTLSVLQGVADEAKASLEAAIVRLRDVFGWNRTLLHWSRAESGWVFDAEAGVRPWEQGLAYPTRSAQIGLAELAAKGPGLHDGRLALTIGTLDGDFWVEAAVRPREIIVMINLYAQPIPAPVREEFAA